MSKKLHSLDIKNSFACYEVAGSGRSRNDYLLEASNNSVALKMAGERIYQEAEKPYKRFEFKNTRIRRTYCSRSFTHHITALFAECDHDAFKDENSNRKGSVMREQFFYDYYEDLQVSPNADLETIERVFRLLAKRYHTDNNDTGSIEKFETITKAYKILSNPEKRAAYDATYDGAKSDQWKTISRAFAGEGFESDRHIRRTILSILYTKRRENPSNAGVGIVQLENLMQWPGETLDFHVWYLKEKNLIHRTDTGGFEITADGVDKIEKDGLVLRNDRLLTQSAAATEDADEDVYLIEADEK